jgi:hypothetical protein
MTLFLSENAEILALQVLFPLIWNCDLCVWDLFRVLMQSLLFGSLLN